VSTSSSKASHAGGPPGRWFSTLILALACLLHGSAGAADVKEARRDYASGKYARVIETAEKALRDKESGDDWPLLLCQALLETGQYPKARTVITNAIARDRWNVRFRWQAREAFLANGDTAAAKDMAETVVRYVSSRPRDYRDAASLVVFGRAALLAGGDPKRVLDSIFEAARKADPNLRDSYLAAGQLALEKHDYAMAARKFEEGVKQFPDDPDFHYGLARSYGPSDPALMGSSLEAALERNENHVPSLLLLADNSIDGEDYARAGKLLEQVFKVNPSHPEGWAYRAVLAHFRNQPDEERSARDSALKFWPTNPRVDYLIGKKLSQSYRFAEGAACQRRALANDKDYLPAKAQLAQDLLRLGHEDEGWQLAAEVQKEDAYDVEAYNLTTLHESMEKFTAVTNQDFIIRMSPREAALYGERALALLSRAKSNLCARYGLEMEVPTIVEIFPEQKDFAVRTFGIPGNPGYLGVCFGSVITANSPASHPGTPVNWEAVLWHEFAHVVTLQLTRNKMPRWLSEGISVYEELEANPAWGQRMNPRYREMIFDDELTPVSKLSGAFLAPRSDLHLQFAYYQSALVVEFLVKRFGFESLKSILRDLGRGVEINQAIAGRTAPMDKVEKEFAAFARERAEKLAPGLDFSKPISELAGKGRTEKRTGAARWLAGGPDAEAWKRLGDSIPTNFWVMTRKSEEFVEGRQWAEAKPLLQDLVRLYPDFTGSDSAYRLLAATHRSLGETNEERQVLARFAARDDKAVDAYLRLMELGTAAGDWPAVVENAQRYLAVNPLVPPPYRYLARASEQLGQTKTGIEAWRALLRLDPPDPAEAHFRLARLLHQANDPDARRHLLNALEEAPRYREALRLLLELNKSKPQS
jgi:tetratricopeptide (TPR) repeat protein